MAKAISGISGHSVPKSGIAIPVAPRMELSWRECDITIQAGAVGTQLICVIGNGRTA